MKRTLCVIDDKIPVSQYPEYFKDTNVISESVLSFLLKADNTVWDDDVVKKLFDSLLKESDDWNICAFTSPHFYNNYVSDTIYSPDVIIYDWDYNSIPDDSETCLLDILKKSFTLIFIFTGSDKIDEIKTIIKKKAFKPFCDRLILIDKNGKNSVNKVFTQFRKQKESNFSLQYGHDFLYRSNCIINRILSEISQLRIEDYIASIGDGTLRDGKYIASDYNFVDAFLPRYKNALYENTEKEFLIKKTKEAPIKQVRRIWSYRLYNCSKKEDELVSMGDIIKKGNRYFIVLASDCHMHRFWKKNGGHLPTVPIVKVKSKLAKDQYKLMVKGDLNETSVSNCNYPLTILPAVPINSTQMCDFLVLPKGVKSIMIKKPSNVSADCSLKYSHIPEFEKIASIQDPFKSPLLQFIMDNITGYGCPDFAESLKADLKTIVSKAKS